MVVMQDHGSVRLGNRRDEEIGDWTAPVLTSGSQSPEEGDNLLLGGWCHGQECEFGQASLVEVHLLDIAR